ncbi:unnamed protein product [Symbiodinium necroappetens]|uniref:Uncharacterized protein n=1 Tax=Symbiodinium necroappetens TaxID=1628268 RepID=A0A812U8C9_9DINO|nr:unnamed protein product [Symbiodinium necroappetens]
MDRLGTGSLSSKTLQRGMDLANQPLANLLGVKEEPTDDDEAEMQAEIQDIFQELMAQGLNGGSIPVEDDDEDQEAQAYEMGYILLSLKMAFPATQRQLSYSQCSQDAQPLEVAELPEELMQEKPAELQQHRTQDKPAELPQPKQDKLTGIQVQPTELQQPKQDKPPGIHQVQPTELQSKQDTPPGIHQAPTPTELQQPQQKQDKPAGIHQLQPTELQQPKQDKPPGIHQAPTPREVQQPQPKQDKPAGVHEVPKPTELQQQPMQDKPARKRDFAAMELPATQHPAKRFRGKTTPTDSEQHAKKANDAEEVPPVPAAPSTHQSNDEAKRAPTEQPQKANESSATSQAPTPEQPQKADESSATSQAPTTEQPKEGDKAFATSQAPTPEQPKEASATSQAPTPEQTVAPVPQLQQQAVSRPSDSAVDKRLRRVMAPNSEGEYRVSEEIRKLWADPGNGRAKVLKLFEDCQWNKELFTKRYSLKTSLEKEHEVSIPFDYLSKQEMEEERNMDPEDILNVIAKAEKDPARYCRWHATKKGVRTYYVEGRVSGHRKQINRAVVNEEQSFEDGSMPHIEMDMDLEGCTSAAARAAENPASKVALEKEVQKMISKIQSLRDEMDSTSEELSDLQTQGVVDGWDETLRCTKDPPNGSIIISSTPKYAKHPMSEI